MIAVSVYGQNIGEFLYLPMSSRDLSDQLNEVGIESPADEIPCLGSKDSFIKVHCYKADTELEKVLLKGLICLYFDNVCYKFENTLFDNKIIKITFPCDGFIKQSLVFKQDGIERMIREGYERTKELITPIFSNGYQDLEFIYNAIGKTSKGLGRLRITGDVLVTNLNKITKQLTKRKIL